MVAHEIGPVHASLFTHASFDKRDRRHAI